MIENKIKNANFDTTPGSVGLVTYLSAITVGATEITRVGKKISVVKYEANITLTKRAPSTSNDEARIILFIDRKNVGILPTITEVLESSDVDSLRNHNNFSRFRILRDSRWVLPLDDAGPRTMKFKWFIPFKSPLKIEYKGTDSLIASASTNSLFVLTLGIINTPGLESEFHVHSRITFKDS